MTATAKLNVELLGVKLFQDSHIGQNIADFIIQNLKRMGDFEQNHKNRI